MFLIRKARVLLGNFWRRVNILVNDEGKIVKIYKSDYANRFLLKKVDAIYNAKERLLLPGIIDMHVHFREPGHEYKEDFLSGSKAAIAGGVTVVADMPNNKPRINTFEKFIKKINIVKDKSYVDFLLYFEMPRKLSELQKFAENKVFPAGVKVYMYIKEEEKNFLNIKLPNNLIYVVHAEDGEFIKEKYECNSYHAFESARSRKAEIEAIKKTINVGRRGVRVHITHLSTLDGLMEIIRAKKEGIKITTDVTLHHLFFTKKDGERLGGIAKCYPPLRDELDRRALVNGIKNGWIDAIITDHAPHAPSEKKRDLCEAPAGIATIEYFYPLLFRLANKNPFLDINKLIKMVSEKPAKILGLSDRGRIKVGSYADLVIYDKAIKWKVRGEDALSKAKVTPWENMKLKGKVIAVFLRGNLVYENGIFIKRNGIFLTNTLFSF